MITASPITRQTVGRTFSVTISLLGLVAVMQLSSVIVAFLTRPAGPAAMVESPAVTTPLTASLKTGPVPAVSAASDANPLAVDPLAAEPAVPPKPTPLPARPPALPEPEQDGRFKETIAQGKLLRDRGDLSTALTRFREAQAMDARNPEAIFELAMTLEKMQLADKAAEQWRRLVELGESAGSYFVAADVKLKQVQEATMRAATQSLPVPAATQEPEEGIAAGKTLGLLKVTTQEIADRESARRLAVQIPIKARAREKIDVRDLTIQVLFYDLVDNQNLVQTTANVSSRWISTPADWTDGDTETLEVEYQLPLPEARVSRRENRNYFGYLIRIYYKGDLQGSAGEPERLLQKFPPEPTLPAEPAKSR